MGIMRLNNFFRRFDSARDVLKEMAARDSGSRVSLKSDLAADFVGAEIYNGGDVLDRKKSFVDMKSDASVLCLGLCYVPSVLVRDIEFAEGRRR